MKVISDWEYFGLKGKVKMIRVYKYRAYKIEDSVVLGDRMSLINDPSGQKGDQQDLLLFNEQGQLVESQRYASYDTTNFIRTVYTYHKNGELLEEIHSRSKDKEEYHFKYINIFDSTGKKTEMQEIHYATGTPLMRWIHTYDSTGFIVRTDAILRTYGLQNFYKYKYDQAGDVAEEARYTKDSVLITKLRYPFKPRKEICEYYDKTIVPLTKYDAMGNWVEVYCENSDIIRAREITYFD